ncbi:MAG TPA: tRNA (N6-threonylcarbamoyladenosine(37)-N6)-methyltransferase TrmO [Planctomycetota bacterium]|nr:tRNA (N6-threonylcarbamoyladenosine(37)-N6)-methyltransferase TrmO [Planctomycetota bacterium]
MARARYDLPDDLELVVRPIGVVRSPFRVHDGTPRQPGAGEVRDGEIVLRPGLQNALKDLKTFSHVWVLFWFSFSRGFRQQVTPPRDRSKRGVFATRAPHRPNPIGLSAVRLLWVQGSVLRVRGLDMLDGTPVLDLKPYVPYADRIAEATSGWIAGLGPAAGPDHRDTRREAPPPR